jgi:uncharacterized membrane protein YhhN
MTFNLFDFGVMVMIMMMVMMMMMTLLTRFPIYSLGACHFMKVSVIESL